MALNLKDFSANYKLCTTNYKAKGTTHDDISLCATAPFDVEFVFYRWVDYLDGTRISFETIFWLYVVPAGPA